jgi:hypothetical protein
VSASTVTRTGLDLEDATGDEDELFLAGVGALDAHRARLDAGDQRRVRGRIPSSPDSPGSATNLASPEKMDSSALTTST